jgi:hypothetical protein
MNCSRLRLAAVVLCIFLSAVAPASAQVATGIPPFSSMAPSTFDAVNLTNLNVHFEIPVVHKAGVGLPFNYNLVYDNSVWYPVGTYWFPTGGWGWQPVVPSQFGSFNSMGEYQSSCRNYNGQLQYYNVWDVFAYTEPNGTLHEFSNITISDAEWVAPQCSAPPMSGTGTANDGSGYTFSISVNQSDNLSALVNPPSGVSITPPLYSVTLPPPYGGSVADTNSNPNQITASVSNGITTFTDTLGATALTVSGSGTQARPVGYKYTGGGGGGAESYQVNYTQQQVQPTSAVVGCTSGVPTL